MPDKINILDIKINNIDMEKAENKIRSIIEARKMRFIVVTPNSEMVVRAQNDRELKFILNNANMSIPDGAGVVLASKILPVKQLPERVAGFDLMENLFVSAEKSGYSIYLLGGEPGVSEKAVENIMGKHPEINICGYHHGYLDRKQQRQVIAEINHCRPDLLFVGMGVPLQEKFLWKNSEQMNFRVGMTVGGSFDVLAGKAERAPLWMQKAYLEWLFRLLKEPSRLSRMVALPRFVFMVFWETIFGTGGGKK